MRTTGTGPVLGVLACLVLACLVLAGALPAGAAKIPQPVSPGSRSSGVVAEARCPTFSWAGVPGARGYELAVFRVSGTPAAQPVLVSRASVPGDARAFTPPVGQCLERGQRYGWSVAATASESQADDQLDQHLDWAPAFLFEVEAAPSPDELQHAVATIERYLFAHHDGTASSDLDVPLLRELRAIGDADADARRGGGARQPSAAPAPAQQSFLPGSLTAPSSVSRTVSAASTPTLGTASLTVANQIHLAAASDLFKNGVVFLWDDTDGNTALGRNALASVSGTATNNTALGREALQNTTGGGSAAEGSNNTAVGDRALSSNTTGYHNTASGVSALRSNTTGDRNTACGAGALTSNTTGDSNTASGSYALQANTTANGNTASGNGALLFNTTGHSNTASGALALRNNSTGDRNTALGHRAGYSNTTGNDSIFINNEGAGDTATIKIGTSGTQTKTFIAGIRGVTTTAADATGVLISSTGQLGTMSSSRSLKQDIQDLGPLAGRLLDLRPVAFRYRQHAAADPVTPLQFGLIAEEVAEIFPELVVYDEEGKPETVRYHFLSSLLLGELQRQDERALEQRAEIQRLGARLEAMENQAHHARRGAKGDRDRSPRAR